MVAAIEEREQHRLNIQAYDLRARTIPEILCTQQPARNYTSMSMLVPWYTVRLPTRSRTLLRLVVKVFCTQIMVRALSRKPELSTFTSEDLSETLRAVSRYGYAH